MSEIPSLMQLENEPPDFRLSMFPWTPPKEMALCGNSWHIIYTWRNV